MNKIISVLLVIIMTLAIFNAAFAKDTPSDYAAKPIGYLMGNLNIDADFYKDYDAPVKRAEFAYLSVILYYELINSNILTDTKIPNPFSDTKDPYIIKAFELGIVNGVSDDKFAPDEPITREQITALFMRVLDSAKIPYNMSDTSNIDFSDEWQISIWAKDSVKRAYLLGVINGVAHKTIAPQNNVTREQALTLIYNILRNIHKIKNNYTRGEEIPVPQIKYSGIGKYDTGWVEEAYNSTPAVCDLNGDGNLEIISSAYSILNIDAKTGNLNWRINSGYDRSGQGNYVGRTWSDIIVKDIDADTKPEIITGHSDGTVSVYNNEGYFKTGWPQKAINAEIKSVKVCDLDLDGTDEIIVGAGVEDGTNVWVFEHDGTLRTGWPQLNTANDAVKTPNGTDGSYAWGIFNDNISVGDINGDNYPEIIVPSDVPFICAYDRDGNLIPANTIFGNRAWGKVGVWEDYSFEKKVENEGWGASEDWRTGLPVDLLNLPRTERYTVNFSFGKSLVTDVNGDGKNEVVVTGNVYDRAYGFPPPGKYQGLFIFNGDRTRFTEGKYHWEYQPTDTGAPISEDWNEIELCMPDPVAEDIDSDGNREIIYPTYDGSINCFWLDRSSWKYTVFDGVTKEFASSPAVVDINNDGLKEIIFTTFTSKNSSKTGSLYILSFDGNVIQKVQLPKSLGDNPIPNGALGSPLVSCIDGDGRYEIVINSYLGGVIVYDI